MSSKIPRLALVLLATALTLAAPPARAALEPSSDVLLPYFELDLAGFDRTTLFAIGNDSKEPVEILIAVHTNWGIPVLTVPVTLAADEVKTANLRDWLVSGNLPNRRIGPEEMAHLQAALSGKASPRDNLFYGTEVVPGRAVGYITFRVQGVPRPDVLWGDYFILDPRVEDRFAQGETLVDLDRATESRPDCSRHGVRFLEGGAFDAGTELMIWTHRKGRPSPTPEYADDCVTTEFNAYDEQGRMIDRRRLDLLPVEMVDVGKLGLSEPYGWFDLITEGASFVTAHFSSGQQYSLALHSYCLRAEEEAGAGPSLRIDKLVNGIEADVPTGPRIPVGGAIHWEYIVTNTGDVPLERITVVDEPAEEIVCPAETLEPDAAMTCTAEGFALACQQRNVVTASGWSAQGIEATARDLGYYFGEQRGRLDVEGHVEGEDADVPPGPSLPLGTEVNLRYIVTNTGSVTLRNLVVTDSGGMPVTCPKAVLEPGETTICTAVVVATPGEHLHVATAVGTPECGPEALDTDPTYFSVAVTPGIAIEKLTNGQDADFPPGPALRVGDPVQWSYLVTNAGNVVLTNVTVTDDRGVVVTCPKTLLGPAESMTCTGSGTAVAGQYTNVGTATGTPPSGPNVTAEDPSHYFGQQPQIRIEKLVNGLDADGPPCPVVAVGSEVVWSYVVVNTGDVVLSTVMVTDDQGVAVSCPKTQLEPGESMTCVASGTAVAGPYTNVGTASGQPAMGPAVTASDPACYVGEGLGNQGCTPGYWKNHTDAWPPTGYSPNQTVRTVFFNVNTFYPTLGNSTLLAALGFGGGPGNEGAAEILLRAAVAAVLNASHPDVHYPRTTASVLMDVNYALLQNRDTMLALAATLDADNNRGCPLH